MKTTVGRIRKLIREDLFDYTGKGSTKPVASSDRWGKVKSNVNMLKKTLELLDHAILDDDEAKVAKLLDRVKQFTRGAEQSMYGTN